MKILYLNNTPFDSEKANLIQVKAMCKAMGDLNFDITLSLPGKKPIELEKSNYKTIFRNRILKNKLDKYLNIYSVMNSVRETNPDVIFIRDPLMLFYVLSFSKREIIFESHHAVLHQGIEQLDNFYRWLLKKGVSNGRIKKVICISNNLKNYWREQGISAGKLLAAHDGIDVKLFNREREKEVYREKLGLPLNKLIVTYSGRLYLNRRIDQILELAEDFPQAYFLIVGGPNKSAENFRNEASLKGLKNIKFEGQVAHELIPDFLAASDILLALWSSDVPTINYCSPLKLFEYMASKKIILAHGFPSIKEVIQDNENGILVEPDNLNDLKIKLQRAIDSIPFSTLGSNAYDDVVENFTWKKRVEKIFEVH